MSTQTATSGSVAGVSDYWLARRDQLFLASCISLIVTAMSFAIRGDIMNTLHDQFNLTNEQMGNITQMAFLGFTGAMIIGGPLADVLGLGRLMLLAFLGHIAGIFLTIFASGYSMLFLGTLLMGLGNGFVEAACNPLLATLYPDQKIRRLNLFHAWFPGGIVIGGVISYLITQANLGGTHGWQVKMGIMLLPLAIYAFLFMGKKFPATERVASGVSTSSMFKECLRPFFLLFVACMLMTAVTELGPQQWFPSILSRTTHIEGILFLIWITGLMAVGRQFAGPIVHRISPVAMLIASSAFAAVGLFLISQAQSAAPAFIAATLFAIGVCFFWPTMLGVVSERFPRTGALGLAIMGGAGMLASGYIQPIIGKTYDSVAAQAAGITLAEYQAKGGKVADQFLAAGGAAALKQVVVLPIILIAVFTAIFLYDKARGGYKQEVLNQDQPSTEAIGGAVSPVNQA